MEDEFFLPYLRIIIHIFEDMLVYKYRLYPSKKQQEKLWIHANKLNWIYNQFLDQKINTYKNTKKNLSRYDLQAQLPKLKQRDPVIKEIHSQVLQQVPKRLNQAFKDFYKRGNKGFPNFRSSLNFFGICYPQSGYSISGNVFRTKIYGKMSFLKYRPIRGNIRQVYITSEKNGWFICITTDYEKDIPKATDKIGIDVGLKDLVVTSEGKHIKNCSHAKYFDKQIAKISSRIDKKKNKKSRSRKFLCKVRRRLYDVKKRKINDFQHKVSKRLSSECDTIFAENLSVKKMSEGELRNLNKSIRNAKLANFISYLSYKTNTLVLVNPKNTSKTCNHCGNIRENLKLSERTITCDKCGEVYDRDENAAKNVYCLGQAIQDLQLEPEYAELFTIQEALALRQE